MSKILRNAQIRSLYLRLGDCPPQLRPLHLGLAVLQHVLAKKGCTLAAYDEELVIMRALREDACIPPGYAKAELLNCLANLCARLTQGERDPSSEYRLTALIYELYNGVQDMHALQQEFDRVFHWISTDAALRRIGNNSGLAPA